MPIIASLNSKIFQYRSTLIYRKVIRGGLSTEYGQDETITSYIRQLFALPFLPHKAMVDTFNLLKIEVDDDLNVKLQELFIYAENTWFNPRRHAVYSRAVGIA